MIELKNINLSKVNTFEQYRKCIEEEQEFLQAVAIDGEDKEHAIEEFWDVVQSKLGLLQKTMNISASEVMEGYNNHLEKIKNRPR